MKNLVIDGRRLWDSLMKMAEIGATDKGGNRRLALSDLDGKARDLFVSWCEDAGCALTVDAMGNIFARRSGRDDTLAPVVMGSHLDTQPTGGRFDGVFGVLAGLEVIRSLNELDYETAAPVEVAVWTNEEGSRFAPAMIGSGVFAGVFDLDYGHSRTDAEGAAIGDELARIGYAGSAPCGGRRFAAFFEAHIEQGPILEDEGKTIGVVTGVQGISWYEITLTGQESHAGTTPSPRRRDALLGAARIAEAVDGIAAGRGPEARGTVGTLTIDKPSINVVPGHVSMTVDLRHPELDVLEEMDGELRRAAAGMVAGSELEMDFQRIWTSPPVDFDAGCIDAVRRAAEAGGFAHRDIVSGAGHDAVYISRVAPTAMIFVPCEGGISHNEIENATPEDLAAGCQVLLRAAVEKANAPATEA